MKPDYKLVAKAKYIHLTADLAAALWQECYKKFYPPKQLDALVQRLQSADAIEEDIDGQANYFVVQLGGKPVGYFAWKMENTALHLLHLYLLPGTSWPPASGWPAATARAGYGCMCTPKPSPSSPFSRSGATVPARPRRWTRAASGWI